MKCLYKRVARRRQYKVRAKGNGKVANWQNTSCSGATFAILPLRQGEINNF